MVLARVVEELDGDLEALEERWTEERLADAHAIVSISQSINDVTTYHLHKSRARMLAGLSTRVSELLAMSPIFSSLPGLAPEQTKAYSLPAIASVTFPQAYINIRLYQSQQAQ
jgi:hypothetical protein